MTNTQKILFIVLLMLIIIILDVCLNKCTNRLIDSTLSELGILKEFLVDEKDEESKIKGEELNKKWFEYENKLSFYIEHDELEKISAKIAIISENALNKEYESALEDVIETKYLLEHVKEKNKLKLSNIF